MNKFLFLFFIIGILLTLYGWLNAGGKRRRRRKKKDRISTDQIVQIKYPFKMDQIGWCVIRFFIFGFKLMVSRIGSDLGQSDLLTGLCYSIMPVNCVRTSSTLHPNKLTANNWPNLQQNTWHRPFYPTTRSTSFTPMLLQQSTSSLFFL